MSQKFEKLKTLLKELFQLDQPDLDFGLYRIMHAKSAEVTQFLDEDLLPQVQQAFGLYKTSDKAELEKELAKAIEQAQSLGADPEMLPKVKELHAKLADDAVDIGGLENEVYDHLFSFFRRYYSEGDFLAKRVYRPGVYAIPYEGEEVKLHWANRDQYYVKTSEYLRDYAFRLKPDDAANPMRVHFRLVDAAEGEHGNIKAVEGKDRVFILEAEDFIAEEDGDLFLRFAYRPAILADWPETERKGKKKPPAQKDLTASAVSRVLAVTDAAFTSWVAALAKPHVNLNGETPGHSRLEGHLKRYTARNTFDYFIHKDLGGFLRRELDYYVKNEVMHLDDIESDTAPRVEQYLSKIKVIRRIAGKIINFLAQLEDFQKKLWLKKKFVIETQYCITLDRIPEEFYPEIAANDAQREEWVQLFAINKLKADLSTSAYSEPLSIAFLKAFPTLMIDTRHFSINFRYRILAAIDDLDTETGGILVHSENFQGLRLIAKSYERSVQCVYIDPPYNTDASAIAYKNNYKDSSWLSLIENRLAAARKIIRDDGIACIAIDDTEFARLKCLIDTMFTPSALLGVTAIRSNPAGRSTPKGFSEAHEYALFVAASELSSVGRIPRSERQLSRYNERDSLGPFEWVNFRKHGGREATREARRRMYFPIFANADSGTVRLPKLEWEASSLSWFLLEKPEANEEVVWPLNHSGQQLRWKWGSESFERAIKDFCAKPDQSGKTGVYMKARMKEEGMLPLTWWDHKEYSATEYGTNLLTDMFGRISDFSFPKAFRLVVDCLKSSAVKKDSRVLDFFAGSGTTGHAVIALNREDGGTRQFTLIETGAYFDTVLLPRIKKVMFAPEWRDGAPRRLATPAEAKSGPRVIKLVRLESYEDTLNNLVLGRTTKQDDLLASTEAQGADRLKEQYMLRYMLDVETRGSQSLLNIKAFADPTAYQLKVKQPGSDESREVNVDLLETFNWLVGLTVQSITAPQSFAAEFERDTEGRLTLKGRLRPDRTGPWWFRTVTGTSPGGQSTLIIWRKCTSNPEEDNLVLDTWFTRAGYSAKDRVFGLIYVNGDNNLENMKTAEYTWKVRSIEEDFHRLMFDTEGR